jgi:hypothetical protein
MNTPEELAAAKAAAYNNAMIAAAKNTSDNEATTRASSTSPGYTAIEQPMTEADTAVASSGQDVRSPAVSPSGDAGPIEGATTEPSHG